MQVKTAYESYSVFLIHLQVQHLKFKDFMFFFPVFNIFHSLF